MPELPDDIYFDVNGALTERRRMGGQDVVVHYDDIPDTDITVVRGIPCTTALRTVIDLALRDERLQFAIRACVPTVERRARRLGEPTRQFDELRRARWLARVAREMRELVHDANDTSVRGLRQAVLCHGGDLGVDEGRIN